MKALRTSSVAGLETTLQANQTAIINHANAISILNGDASTEGSLAKTLADMKAHVDTLEWEVDLSQMNANTASISLLNDTTPGKVGSVQTQFQDAQDQAATYADTVIVEGTSGQLSVLSNNVDTAKVDLETKFDDLVANADAMHDTLGELQAADAEYQQEISDLSDVVVANKASIEAALQAHKDNFATDKSALIDKFDTERNQTNTDIASAINTYNTAAEGKFFAIGNGSAFDGISADNAASCRTNINAANMEDLETNFTMGYKRNYVLEDKTVEEGKITLPTDVTPPMLKHIRIEYPGFEYDTLVHTVGEIPGEFIVQDYDAGDLDGIDVSVRYVTSA